MPLPLLRVIAALIFLILSLKSKKILLIEVKKNTAIIVTFNTIVTETIIVNEIKLIINNLKLGGLIMLKKRTIVNNLLVIEYDFCVIGVAFADVAGRKVFTDIININITIPANFVSIIDIAYLISGFDRFAFIAIANLINTFEKYTEQMYKILDKFKY